MGGGIPTLLCRPEEYLLVNKSQQDDILDVGSSLIVTLLTFDPLYLPNNAWVGTIEGEETGKLHVYAFVTEIGVATPINPFVELHASASVV